MDRDMLAKLATRYTRRAEPVSLTPDELDLEHCKVTRVVPGVPAWAWIRFPASAELVAGEALRGRRKRCRSRGRMPGIGG